VNIITLDLETHYDSKTYTLKKSTTEEYIRDPRFQAIGVAVKVNDGETDWASGTHKELRGFLKNYDFENSMLVCQNTMFDGFILSEIFGIHAKRYADTMLMAKAIHGFDAPASLKALAELYGVGQKGTEVISADGMRREDFTEEELSAYGDYCINDVELTYDIFSQMVRSGFPKKEMQLIDLTLKMFVRPLLVLDRSLLATHLKDIQQKKEALLTEAGHDKDDLMSNPKFAELLRSYGVVPPTKISPTTGKEAFAFAKTDDDFKALAEHPDIRVQAIVAARLGTKSTIEETRTERFIGISERGLLPVPLKYYGAKTGRWAAEGSINLQNVPRDSTLKRTIMAPEGHVIVGADLSNIELRVGLWIAGQMDKLELLGKGVDLYKDFASSVFNTPYDEVTKAQRFIGKTSQLSLIYGVGAIKIRAAIKAGSGSDIGEDEAKRIVSMYRSEYANVARVWRTGEEVLKAISRDDTYYIGRNEFCKVNGKKGLLLPSGLYLRYTDLRCEMNDDRPQWDYASRYGRDKIYGSKVFQGLTQAVARCIMAEHMLQLSKHYPIALTVHDALYMVVPEDEADAAMQLTLSVMRTPPDWMPDIPLDAEAGYGKTLKDC